MNELTAQSDFMRGFEVVKSKEHYQPTLPKRATKYSAGYDFRTIQEIVIKPHIKFSFLWWTWYNKPTLIETGIKAYFPTIEVLKIANRSGLSFNQNILLVNGEATIDADHYNNPKNEGEIKLAFYNFSNKTVIIPKGEKIAQGIFVTYQTIDNDFCETERIGEGFSSTDK
jgi:dUTP pyrophosphatase